MQGNLWIYEQSRYVPENAQKKIQGGRINGMTDINPMWRIKKLTELFGPCGIGWKTVITKQWLEKYDNGEVKAFCNIDLYIKVDGEWSEPITATGGSSFVEVNRNGLYVSDECYKMAYTDAISVACKMLGFGADVYWQKDSTKYEQTETSNFKPQIKLEQPLVCKKCGGTIKGVKTLDGIIKTADEVARLTGGLCAKCSKE